MFRCFFLVPIWHSFLAPIFDSVWCHFFPTFFFLNFILPFWRHLIPFYSFFFTFLWIFWRPISYFICYHCFQILLSLLPPLIPNLIFHFVEYFGSPLSHFLFSLLPLLSNFVHCHPGLPISYFFLHLYSVFFWYFFFFIFFFFFSFPSISSFLFSPLLFGAPFFPFFSFFFAPLFWHPS